MSPPNPSEVAQLKETLALGCRILASEGQEDIILGHISARFPGTEVIYMKPHGLALAEIEPEDIVSIDLEGNKLEGEGRVHSEAAIHTEIYRLRRDVNSVVHTHPLFTTAFSSVGREVQVLSHDGVLFVHGVPFEEDPELIVTKEQGRAVAQRLGDKNAVILRNHGIVVVGISVPWAVFTSITLERTIKIQAIANIFGKPEPIPHDTALRMFPTKYNQRLTDQYWDYYVRRVTGNRHR